MSLVRVVFHTERLVGGAPVPGATIRSTPPNPGDPGPWTIQTDSAGNFAADLTPGRYRAFISALGFQEERRDWVFGDPFEANPVRIGLVPRAGAFKVSGPNFLDPLTNGRIVYSLADSFPAYRFWLDGRRDDLERKADEDQGLGFAGWRIFGAGAIAENQVMELNPWTDRSRFVGELPVFGAWLQARGMVGLWTVNVDMQVLQRSESARVENFLTTCDAFRNGAILISYGNEHSKNGFNPYEAPDPGPGIVWSRGSDVSDISTAPNGATAAEFHQRRDIPKMLDDSVASSTDMQYRQGFGMIWMDEPIGFDEVPSGSRSTDPYIAWKLARVYSTYWALAVFHSSAGQRGRLLGPTAKACAAAWNQGIRL